MLQWTLRLILLMSSFFTARGVKTLPFLDDSGEPDLWEEGSGVPPPHLLHSLHADRPADPPGRPVNCSQRFWLPPSSDVCWEDVAGPEDLARSRLLVLQNRAALQAVSSSSGVEEGGASYEQQAREEVRGVVSDHLSAAETLETMEKVFASLEELRRDEKRGNVFSSMSSHLSDTREALQGKERLSGVLEDQFSSLEETLLDVQLRILKLIQQ